MYNRKKIAHILIVAGSIGFAFVVYRTLAQAEFETFKVDVPLTALTQTGFLVLSASLIAAGSYLTGYRKGSTPTSHIRLDFSKKTDSSTKM